MGLIKVTRRGLIAGGVSLGGLMLAGCDRLSQAPSFQRFTGSAEGLTYRAQRLLLSGQPLAREFDARDMSPVFKVNGTRMPGDRAYKAMLAENFANWRLRIDGLVERPAAYSIGQLRTLSARSQITRHDCVEGWSAIGKWTGVPLAALLARSGVKPNARFAVFHCADDLEGSSDGSGLYYESIDLIDAFHPQTILAHALNDKPLSVGHGAPLRLRVERQLGYKQAKYVMRVELADSLVGFGQGKGGYWEDRGYEWYAGI
jgi:DMSO/TMAO reductase YedYZ molybdopterin-dependent catalytic subunit